MRKSSRIKRLLLFLGGISILTFGARVMLLSGLGVGGLDAVAIGLADIYGCRIGTMILVLGIILIIIGDMINKKCIVHPIFTSWFVGWLYDLWGIILFDQMASPETESWIGFLYLIGLLIAPMGAAIYMLSHISLGPVDYLMVAVTEHTSLPMRRSRTLLEALFVFSGWLIGGPIGMGTIGIMLFWGPILQVYYQLGTKFLGIKER